uniref:C-type lectin domain-containing protein n=1 Tax=Romanomermis culicivorax TaxID=13658 RepID=A0A915JTY5_ROMCU
MKARLLTSLILSSVVQSSSALSGSSDCSACKNVVDTFLYGMAQTRKAHFGGGNTAWEEERLGKYQNSEVRYHDIADYVCKTYESLKLEKDDERKCHDFMADNEEDLETWYFHKQNQAPDLKLWFCIEKTKSPCLSGWSSYMGRCYSTINSLMTFDEASSACSAKGSGARLLTIDQQEQFYYAATLANQMSSNVWLGLKFDSSQGSFKWVTGQTLGPTDYQAWGYGQPKSQTMQKCVAVVGVKGFVWETSDCTKRLKVVCSFGG